MINIAFYNNKGGVGKTTISTNIAHGLAQLGYYVEYFATDGQLNECVAFGIPIDENRPDFLDFITGAKSFSEVAILARKNLVIVPMNNGSVKKVNEYVGMQSRNDLLYSQKVFKGLNDVKGIRIFDCGPDKGKVNDATLYFADHIICPVEVEIFAVSGVANLGKYLEELYIPISRIKLIIPNKYDARLLESKTNLATLKESLPNNKVTPFLSNRTSITKGQRQGHTIFELDRSEGQQIAENEIVSIIREVVKVIEQR